MASALDGVVVLDLTREVWGGMAGALLGDFGARVIRVEDLGAAAPDRDRDGQHPPAALDGLAELIHRNKQSVGLDLAEASAGELLQSLVASADVLLTDWSLAELAARGLSYADAVAQRADLIYARGSGLGPHGPEWDAPALDELAAARTGMMPTLPEPELPPVHTGTGQMYTTVMLAFGILAALHHREQTGEGQAVDASLFGGHLYAATLTLDAWLAMREDRLGEPRRRFDAANPMSGIFYPASDGRWVTVTMPDTDRWWPAFAEMMGLAVDDPRFDSHDKRCGENRLEMMRVLEERFGRETSAYWRTQFDARRLSADIIERYDYPARHEQARINRYVLELEHPSFGAFRSLGFPIHMSDTPARLRTLAPCLGQHTALVLGELLGLGDARIAELEAARVVGTRRVAEPRVAPVARIEAPPPRVARREGGPRPLDGLRVLDASVWFQGPVCAQFLADFGAEVIHIERPVTGDQARGVKSIAAVPVAEWNQYFLCVNRNKKSLAVDLKSEGGRDLMHRLVAKSDVFLWNQGLESLPGLGLDYETLSRINPRLVYATNSGYGHAGGFSKPSFDMTVQALTGIMARQGEPGQAPIYLGLGAGDAYGGLMSALGILLALHARRHSDRGQAIDASLYGAQLLLGATSLQPYLATGDERHASQQSRKQCRNPLWNRYRASDAWIFVCAANDDESWRRLCEVLERADLIADRRFASATDRREHNEALIAVLDGVYASRSAAEWVERSTRAGIPAARIRHIREIADDEQAWANDYLVHAQCDEIGEQVALRGLPVTLARTPGRVDTLGPELGQDTEMILFELLGLDWDRIGELKEQGVIP